MLNPSPVFIRASPTHLLRISHRRCLSVPIYLALVKQSAKSSWASVDRFPLFSAFLFPFPICVVCMCVYTCLHWGHVCVYGVHVYMCVPEGPRLVSRIILDSLFHLNHGSRVSLTIKPRVH